MKERSTLSLILINIISLVFYIIPHPYNLSPFGANSVLSGTTSKKPLLSMLISTITLYIGSFLLYHQPPNISVVVSYGLITFISYLMKDKFNFKSIPLFSIIASSLFFLITNGCMIFSGYYQMNLIGLGMSYVAGIPFAWTTFIGDLIFTSILTYSVYLFNLKTNKL